MWLMLFDDEREAREAEEAAQRVRAVAPESERADQLALRSGRTLLLLRHVPAALQGSVRARFEQWAASERPADERAD